jgi:hypothetical protein
MRLGLLISVLLFAATPALAQGGCVEPAAPLPADGAAMTADQLRAANTEARSFISQSGAYQACLSSEVEAAKMQAQADGRPFDPTIEAEAKARIAASEKAQERVGVSIDAAVTNYKLTHAAN